MKGLNNKCNKIHSHRMMILLQNKMSNKNAKKHWWWTLSNTIDIRTESFLSNQVSCCKCSRQLKNSKQTSKIYMYKITLRLGKSTIKQASTVKGILFVSTCTIFCSLRRSYQFIDSRICGCDNTIIQKNGKFPFSWEPNFMVYQTHKNHKNLYPTNNNTLIWVYVSVTELSL